MASEHYFSSAPGSDLKLRQITVKIAGAIREDGRGADRSAAVDWMLADISRATAVLGWRPDHQLADSVKSIWADPVHRA